MLKELQRRDTSEFPIVICPVVLGGGKPFALVTISIAVLFHSEQLYRDSTMTAVTSSAMLFAPLKSFSSCRSVSSERPTSQK